MQTLSMTGYGNATIETDNFTFSVEVKTLNSKFLELNLKLPKEYSEKELEIRNLITQKLERGKVSVTIDKFSKGGTKPKLQLNTPLFQEYFTQLKTAADSVGLGYDHILRVVMGFPEVMLANAPEQANQEEVEEEYHQLLMALNIALDKCTQFRADEGALLAGKLREYIEEIRKSLDVIEQADPQRIEATRNRIKERLADLGASIQYDQNRFEQELVYYIEKLDINEEKVRLRSHLDYFNEALITGNGKKLGFISQEIGREINTIGSKVNDASIQRFVVSMKEELEKIKEQSLNIV